MNSPNFRRLFLLCALSCVATAVSAQSQPAEPRFALELRAGTDAQPIYALVPRGLNHQAFTSWYVLHAIGPAVDEPVDPRVKACGIQLNYHEDGNAVSVSASIQLAPCSQQGPAKSDSLSPLGTYSLSFGETAVLESMRQFGVEPCTIKVVNAQLPKPTVQVVSNAPSLRITVRSEDRTSFHLTVHNDSSQAVARLVVGMTTESGGTTSVDYGAEKSLIAPGGEYDLKFGSEPAQSPDNETHSEGSSPIVLQAALFADGTSEGDAVLAAHMDARQLAWATQRQRLCELVQNVLADSSVSDSAKVAQLRSQILKFSAESDVMEKIQSRHLDLPDDAWPKIKESIVSSCVTVKDLLRNRLELFAKGGSESSSETSLEQFLEGWKGTD